MHTNKSPCSRLTPKGMLSILNAEGGHFPTPEPATGTAGHLHGSALFYFSVQIPGAKLSAALFKNKTTKKSVKIKANLTWKAWKSSRAEYERLSRRDNRLLKHTRCSNYKANEIWFKLELIGCPLILSIYLALPSPSEQAWRNEKKKESPLLLSPHSLKIAPEASSL